MLRRILRPTTNICGVECVGLACSASPNMFSVSKWKKRRKALSIPMSVEEEEENKQKNMLQTKQKNVLQQSHQAFSSSRRPQRWISGVRRETLDKKTLDRT